MEEKDHSILQRISDKVWVYNHDHVLQPTIRIHLRLISVYAYGQTGGD